MAKSDLFPEADQILSALSRDAEQDMVMLAVPSHDSGGKLLPDGVQEDWHKRAMQVFAELYQGATSFKAHAGIWRDDEGGIHRDVPIMIESFARIDFIEDRARLEKLLAFVKAMGREMKQKSVMLVFGVAMVYIEDFTSRTVKV